MGDGDSRAVSEDGAATAVPLRVVCHIHSVVGAVDIVYISLSLVPVMNFSERDQLDGLALRKQLAKKNFSVCLSHLSAQEPSLAPCYLWGEVHAVALAFWLQSAFLHVYLTIRSFICPKLWPKPTSLL